MKSNNKDIENIHDCYREAGKIHKKVMNEAKKNIKIGMSLLSIVTSIEENIEKYGGKCAFPVNISINEQAAHYTPFINDSNIINENDIIKLDIGVHINGYIADGAQTIAFNNKNIDLIKSSQNALMSAIDIVKSGTKISNIGSIIEETIVNNGYKPIKNLMGHGLDQYVAHADPSIPNFNNGNNEKLIEGQVIAIEPFATNGNGYVSDSSFKNIYSQVKLKPTRVSFIRNILKKIESYYGLPFTTRWIKLEKVLFALNQLEKEGILIGYPGLVEKKDSFVSQTEHTMIVHEWGAEIIT